jgi:hypothetical protein
MIAADEEGLIEAVRFDHAGRAADFRHAGFEPTILGDELGCFGVRCDRQEVELHEGVKEF